jgi:hypothetical protein
MQSSTELVRIPAAQPDSNPLVSNPSIPIQATGWNGRIVCSLREQVFVRRLFTILTLVSVVVFCLGVLIFTYECNQSNPRYSRVAKIGCWMMMFSLPVGCVSNVARVIMKEQTRSNPESGCLEI